MTAEMTQASVSSSTEPSQPRRQKFNRRSIMGRMKFDPSRFGQSQQTSILAGHSGTAGSPIPTREVGVLLLVEASVQGHGCLSALTTRSRQKTYRTARLQRCWHRWREHLTSAPGQQRVRGYYGFCRTPKRLAEARMSPRFTNQRSLLTGQGTCGSGTNTWFDPPSPVPTSPRRSPPP